MPEDPIGRLQRRLQRRTPFTAAPPPGTPRAAVALVVRPAAPDLELLLIRRAERAGDPWSGHMAFPGGRHSPDDRDDQETAVRETHEEVGVDLERIGTPLGRLDSVHPRGGAPAVAVAPFVFAVPPGTHAGASPEVDRALWVPLDRLAAPGAATEYLHALSSGAHLRFPAIGYQEHVIWGLTYRIMTQFLEIAGAVPEGSDS